MKKLDDSDVWSNLFFVVPLILSLFYGIYIHALAIFFVIVFSTLTHIYNHKKLAKFDGFFAKVLIAYNLYLCYLGNFKFPYFYIALIFVFVSFYFIYYKKKDDWEWHLSSAIITLFCILTYMA